MNNIITEKSTKPMSNKETMNTEERKDILLRAAYDLIKRSQESIHIEETVSILTQYDGTQCDGYCLADDIADVLDLDTSEDPIPLV